MRPPARRMAIPLPGRAELERRMEEADGRAVQPFLDPVFSTAVSAAALLWSAVVFARPPAPASVAWATVAMAAVLFWGHRRAVLAMRAAGLVCVHCARPLPLFGRDEGAFLDSGVCPRCGERTIAQDVP